jgi:hypothetical protein
MNGGAAKMPTKESKPQAVFLYVVADGEPTKHRATISKSAFVDLTIVGVKDYAQGVRVAKKLVKQGVQTIELCGGFGHVGAAKIAQAVGDGVMVGVVRFDCHPSLGFKSGDQLFGAK